MFKIGDRVVVREHEDIEPEIEVVMGRKATVVAIDSEWEYPIELEFDKFEGDLEHPYLPELFKEHELELVEE
jgi:hypothetical protein